MFADNDPSLYGKTATNLRRKRGIKAKQSEKQSTLCADFTSIVFRRCGFTFWCHLFHLCCWNVQGCALLAAFEHEYRPLEYCSSFHRPLHLAKCTSNVECWAFGAGFFCFPLHCRRFCNRCCHVNFPDVVIIFSDFVIILWAITQTDRLIQYQQTKKMSKMNTGSAVQAQDCLCYLGDVIKW